MLPESLKLNPFERFLFGLALGIGGAVLLLRLGAVALTYFLHSSR